MNRAAQAMYILVNNASLIDAVLSLLPNEKKKKHFALCGSRNFSNKRIFNTSGRGCDTVYWKTNYA